jgi:hypothetical protein
LQEYLKGGESKRKVINDLLSCGQNAVEDLLIQSDQMQAFNLSIIATDLLKYDLIVEAEKAGPAGLNKVLINKIELRKNLTT